MQSLPEYNGYVNWHSWVIQLWIDNEEWLYNAYQRIVERAARDTVKPITRYRRTVMEFYRDAREYTAQQEHEYIRFGKAIRDDLFRHFTAEVEEYRRDLPWYDAQKQGAITSDGGTAG